MSGFLQGLKEFMINEENSHQSFAAVSYYSTIEQHKDEIKEIISDIESWNYDLRYEHDETEGYTNGKILVHLYKNNEEDTYSYEEYANYTYVIELGSDARHWGYCQCKPSDEGYDPVYECCGNGCDWTAPVFTIEKRIDSGRYSFNGIERDMWEIERKWGGEEDELKQKEVQEKITQLDKRIEELLKQKQTLLNGD